MKITTHEVQSGCVADSETQAALGGMDSSDLSESLGQQLARQMRRRWSRGERPMAEEFLGQHPQLLQRPTEAIDVIYEEYCLRQAAGEEDVEQLILRRFPQWREPLRVMLECHRLLEQPDPPSDFPAVGDVVCGFRLVAELARGARGRVYLATQMDLAGRHVVLKLTPLDGAEHLSLARLQHTNIVPVYSVDDDERRNIRMLCMPYFGRATLASLLKSLAGVPLAARSGRHVVAAIDELDEQTRQSSPKAAPAVQMLAHSSYVEAICSITACLADALQYAHEHGLVHLDVKPSNVLLATDGQPMLLDFHLAHEPIRVGGELPDKFGGTPAYMPPEQIAAMQALRHSVPVESAVDARADIYALGAILHELLGGTVPRAADAEPLSKVNPEVSIGLGDIVAKCLAPRAEDRYACAAALADDLRRHVADQPLCGVPNRSLTERWHKWRRRKPSALRAAGTLIVVVAAAVIALAGAWFQAREHYREAEQALFEGLEQLERGHGTEAAATFQRGLSLIENVPFRDRLAEQLREGLATSRRQDLAGQLHELVDQLRTLYGTDQIPSTRLRPLADLCSQVWQKRQQIAASLDASRDSKVATDLLDVAIIWAEFEVQLASESAAAAARQQALRTLDRAETMFGPSPVLQYQRHLYREALGMKNANDTVEGQTGGEWQDQVEGDALAPRTAWEHYALGRALLKANKLAQAARELEAARSIDPSGPWPNFYYGLCAVRMSRYEDAIAAFSVCIGANPTLAGCFYNRALAYTDLGRTDRARDDYDRALELDPTLAVAWLNRGMLHYRVQRYTEAVHDLRQAMHYGAQPGTVHYDLALVHLASNDTAAALDDLDRAIENEPSHEQARQLRDRLSRKAMASGRQR